MKEKITEKINELEKQQRDIEVSFHRISGAIIVLKQLLEEDKKES